MAIKFEFYESPNTIGTRKKRYHARVVNWQRINTDYLAREIQYGSSLTVADIKATIISLSEKLAYYLKDGARVHIEGIELADGDARPLFPRPGMLRNRRDRQPADLSV